MWKIMTIRCTFPLPYARFPAPLNSLPLRTPRLRERRDGISPLADAARPLARLSAAESFRRNPINLFFQRLFLESASKQNSLSVFNHLRITAEVAGGVSASQFPEVGVFADDVLDAAGFAAPFGVFIRTAYGGDVSEP